MRILHLLDHSLPIGSGYSHRSQAILSAQLARGLDVAAVTGRRHAVSGPNPDLQGDVCVFRTAGARIALPYGRAATDVLALARRAVQVGRMIGAQLLHAHSPVLNGLAGMVASRVLAIPLVYEIRAFWEDAAADNGTGAPFGPRYQMIRAAEGWLAGQADAVVAISAGIARDLGKRGIPARKITCVPNGVSFSQFGCPPLRDPELAQRFGLGGKTVLGFVGSFYPYEGLEDLIAAMPLIRARRPDVALLLVGDGPAAPALRAAAAASPAADDIHFTGQVPPDSVGPLYGLIDIAVYPRRASRLTELVTPLKPLEAMAQGRVVLASDVGGHRELISHGESGLLFTPHEPRALADIVLAICDDPARQDQLRRVGRETVQRSRDWSALVARYDPVYHRVCNASP